MDWFWRQRKWLLLIIAIGGLLWLWELRRHWREDTFDKEILAASRRYGVNAALIKAVIWHESGFDPNARGSKGEIGLMQIMPDTANEWARAEHLSLFTFTDLFIPAKNIQCGTWYLAKVSARYRNTDNYVPYALADYNAGRGNVMKWMSGEGTTKSAVFVEQIGFPGTKYYVKIIGERAREYQAAFSGKP